MNNRISNIISSVSIALIIGGLLMVMNLFAKEGTSLDRLITLLGGDLPLGIIQITTYFLFVFALFEIKVQKDRLNRELKAFDYRLLPEKDNWVLHPTDVAEIKIKAIKVEERKGKLLLLELIKNTCTRYRVNKSTSEALEFLTNVSRLELAKVESEQSLIRFVLWAIPSIGFIGTIIGIANSLGYANSVVEEGGIDLVTSALNVAFDTTLVALFLSIFLMLIFNLLQEKTEKFYTETETYILENLINRIYNR